MDNTKKTSVKLLSAYTLMHLLVDFLCAYAMFSRFIPKADGYFSIFIYNFCAFALQMPLGALLDGITWQGHEKTWHGRPKMRNEYKNSWHSPLKMYINSPSFLAALFVLTGVILTISGMFTHAAILGIGNACFHVGGGVGTMRLPEQEIKIYNESLSKDMPLTNEASGRHPQTGVCTRLGLFVAPGAVGLFAGTILGQYRASRTLVTAADIIVLAAAALLILLILAVLLWSRCISAVACEAKNPFIPDKAHSDHVAWSGTFREDTFGLPSLKKLLFPSACLFIVVILRSFVGMSLTFLWKNTLAMSFLAVLAVAAGKAAGGIFADLFGLTKTVIVSLTAGAVCFLLGAMAPSGLAALFLFNMTMPLTLYLMFEKMPGQPGLAFGILTFALFLGFVPVYFQWLGTMDFKIPGAAACLISALLILSGKKGQSVPKSKSAEIEVSPKKTSEE